MKLQQSRPGQAMCASTAVAEPLTWRSIRFVLYEGWGVPPASSAVHEPLWKGDSAVDLHGTGVVLTRGNWWRLRNC